MQGTLRVILIYYNYYQLFQHESMFLKSPFNFNY